jgi:hypothetical protein
MTSDLSHPSFLPRRPSCVHKMSLEPPTYTPSAAVPTYSVIPRPSERILAATACPRRRTPTGVFLRTNNLVTLALREQDPNASMPSYGRQGVISGDIALSYTQGVQSVYLKVRGHPFFFFCLLSTVLFSIFSLRVDYIWLARMVEQPIRPFLAFRTMFGGGQTKTAVRCVRACSRLRLFSRKASRTTDRHARSRLHTIIRYPVLRRTSGRDVNTPSRLLSNAGEGSWHFGNPQKSECVFTFTHTPGIPNHSLTYDMAWRNSTMT